MPAAPGAAGEALRQNFILAQNQRVLKEQMQSMQESMQSSKNEMKKSMQESMQEMKKSMQESMQEELKKMQGQMTMQRMLFESHVMKNQQTRVRIHLGKRSAEDTQAQDAPALV